MATKTVYFYQASAERDDFSTILLDSRFHQPLRIDQKNIEIKYAEQTPDEIITGIFVATKRDGIAPIHKPGEEDFSAIQLKEGEGLAYPNVFLFDPRNKILLLEYNKAGASATNICEYFHQRHIDLALNILLTEDAYKRIQKMSVIETIEIQVANPTNVIRENFAESATIKDFANIAQNLNATKSLSLIVKGELKTGGLTKNTILQTLHDFLHIGHKTSGLRVSNKFVVTGKQSGDSGSDSMIEETINLFVDKIKGQFVLDEPSIQKDIQAHERKEGIISTYDDKIKEVKKVIDTGTSK